MARQARTSTRKYEQDKTTIKCYTCGNEVKNTTIVRIRGIARWVCMMCGDRINKKKNGN